ncbi:hypothetical protein JVT61DRAFT_1549 [Boletus reticuloceps]|uniref:FAD-binding PCMH-type domain-containing protein n=1 Tax=Boletus reticuloceps TaxID=495285 RepID=A0A8I2YR21_9AGAM|nr:hypothetical protein JVT61DRAFT_1549 [Boletus reticuloceps]
MKATIINRKAVQDAIAAIKEICEGEKSTGKSQYFAFGGEGYKSSVRHFFESSTEIAAGAVQPGSKEDLANILKVIAHYQVPFAVKGGGHATNPRFSSTEGIQISMCRFNKIRLEPDADSLLPPGSTDKTHSIVHIGAGCLFDEVYREVVPKGLNIVGGSSIGGVGVAGWLLGGGYSLKTNQHGLGIDNILQVEIVLPTGVPKTVNNQSQGDDKLLFEVVKGGGNNFGIVTEFTVRAHVQAKPTCGCLLQYEVEDFEDVKTAVVNFAQQEDPKASIVAAFRYYCNPGGIQATGKLTVQCFYDGPLPEKDGPFAELLEIDHKTERGGGDTVGLESRQLPAKRPTVPIHIHMPVTIPDLRVLPDIITPKRSELVVYDNYHLFDYQTSFVNEALDVQDVQVDEIESPPPPAYSYVDVVETASETPGISLTIASGAAPKTNLKTQARMVVPANQSASIETLLPQSRDRMKRAMAGVGENPRGRWGNVMVDIYTKEIIDEIGRQASVSDSWEMSGHGGKRVVIDIWPFTKTMFDNATECAWPHVKDEPNGPILAYFLWEGSENDNFWIQQMERALKAIKKKVDKARGPHAKPFPVYSNTTLDTTRVEDVYGDNFEDLKAARETFDPERVMNLTGGFRIPHPIKQRGRK